MSGPISVERWEQAWTADLEVVRNLRSHGDDPTALREIDVSFRGPRDALERLESACGNFGFAVYLQIEDNFGVECDGWGCMASNGNGPISNENPA